MALEFQTVPIAFTQGLDTQTQRKLVIPGKWDDLLNLTLSADNTPATRAGHSALIATANGNGLATYNQQLLTLSGGYVYSVSTAAAIRVAAPGRAGYVDVSKEEIRRGTGMQDTPDCATGIGFTCYVWREKNASATVTGVSVMLVDEATGTQLLPATSMRTSASVFCPRVVFSADRFYIFYIDGTSLYCRIVFTATPTTVGAETALITSASLGALNFDAVEWFDDQPYAQVSYAWADGVTSVRTIVVGTLFAAPVISLGPTNLFTQAQLPVATLTGLAVCAYTTSAGLSATFATSTGAAAMCGLAGITVDNTLTIVTAATQIDNAVAATTSNVHVTACVNDNFGPGLQVFWDRESEWSTNALNPLRTVVVDTFVSGLVAPGDFASSATFGAGVTARGPQGPFIAGKAFNSNGTVFLPAFVASVYNSLSAATANPRNANTQNTFFVLEAPTSGVQTGVVVAKALYGSYGTATINGNAPAVSTPCSVVSPASGEYLQVATELTQLVLSGGINISPTGLVRLSLAPNFTHPTTRAQLGESTYLAGGQLASYDGAQVVEHGFPLFPEGIGLTAGGAGTGSMTDGVHQVVAIYEWVDNAGQRHQSAPSLPVSVTVNSGGANTGSIAVNVPTMLLSQKGTTLQVVAYCTTAAGLTFYRVTTSGTGLGSISNSIAATTVTITITSSDANLLGNEPLYTQPNQAPTTLANVSPGAVEALAIIHNRLFYKKPDKPFWFGYSQQYINNVGLQFSTDLESAVPADSGGIVAIADLDEKVIVFCKNRPYVMYGQGPQPSGAFNNYSLPQVVESDVGCSDPLSVLKMPMGIMFKSPKGWCMLGRDLSVKYMGEGVSRFDANTVTSAVLLSDEHECRFATTGTAGSVAGTTLVYSYLVDQWSYFSQTNGDGYLPIDAVWWPQAGGGAGRYVTISLASGLNQDTPGVYTDAPGASSGVSILTRCRTGWLHVAKLEGFQRVRKLYLTATTNTLPTSNLFIIVDYDDAYGAIGNAGPSPGAYSFIVNLFTTFFASWSSGKPIDLRTKLRRMKCKSVAFTFIEAAPASNARLTGFQALALEVGMKKGVNRLPAAQSVG